MKGLGLLAILALGARLGPSAGAASRPGTPTGSFRGVPPVPARTDAPLAPGWLSFDDLVHLALETGFSPDVAYVMARIAWRESKGFPGAKAIVVTPLPGNLPERSFGLWQVNTLANPQFDEQALLDPTYNAQAAFQLSRGGTNLRPWGVATR